MKSSLHFAYRFVAERHFVIAKCRGGGAYIVGCFKGTILGLLFRN
jgi:hypothetical protein